MAIIISLMQGKKAKQEKGVKHKTWKGKFETSTTTVDYFPRGGQAEEPTAKSKSRRAAAASAEAEADDFLFNKAPMKVFKKKRNTFEVGSSDQPEQKRRKDKKDTKSQEPSGEPQSDDDVDILGTHEGPLEPVSKRAKLEQPSAGSMSRIRRLVFSTDAVLEVTKYYIIVNFGRNKKGYISATDIPGFQQTSKKLAPGDFITCTVVQGEGTDYRKESGNLNRKMQLTMNPHVFNACLNVDAVTPNMILPAYVASVEEKGCLLELGLADGTQGFIKHEGEVEKLEEKQWILVNVLSVNKKTKVATCTFVSSSQAHEAMMVYNDKVSLETVKPGALVLGTVKQVLTNGVYVQFLKGLEGTVFLDHLKKPLNEYAKGAKLSLRVVMVDIANKVVSLSEKDHMVRFLPLREANLPVKIGSCVSSATVMSNAYGGSYFLAAKLPKPFSIFLHKSRMEQPVKKGEEAKEEKKEDPGFKSGDVVKSVKVKEFNYFDGVYLALLDSAPAELVTWQNIEVGQILTATVDKVVAGDPKKGPHILVKINQFLSGVLPLEHMADRPMAHIPEKLAQAGKQITVRVFSVSKLTKTLILTKKKLFMKEQTPTIKNRSDAEAGLEVYGVVGKALEGGYIIKFMNDIVGFLPNDELSEEKSLTPGQTVRVFVGYSNVKQNKIGLSMTAEGAKKLATKQPSHSDDFKQIFAHVAADLNVELPEEARSALAVGQVYSFRPIDPAHEQSLKHDPESYLILKTVGLPNNFYVHVPKYHLSDYKQLSEKLFDIVVGNVATERDFKGVIINILEPHNTIIVSLKSSLVVAKDTGKFPGEYEELNEGEVYQGYISSVIDKGVFVNFMGNLRAFLSNAELENSFDKAKVCWAGKSIKTAVARLNREDQHVYLSTKFNKIYAGFGTGSGEQKKVQRAMMEELAENVKRFYEELVYVENCHADKAGLGEPWKSVHYGDYVTGKVQMIKEYGVIVQIEGKEQMTGFIMNENKRKKQEYEVGQTVTAKILDIDKERKLLDLSHSKHFPELAKPSSKRGLASCQHQEILPTVQQYITKFPKAKAVRAQVELVKESYAIVSLPTVDCVLAMVPIRLFNQDEKETLLNRLSIGHTLDVKICGYSTQHELMFAVPALTNLRKIWDTDKAESAGTEESKHKMSDVDLSIDTLAVGQKITGKVSSVQGFVAFVHVNRKM